MALTMLIDSSSLIYRAWFAVPDTVRAPDGRSVNGAYGFLNMLARLIDQYRPAEVACAWDDDWRPQWRVDLLESYKAHRVAAAAEGAEAADSIDDQIDLLFDLLPLLGITVLGAKDFEAEDVIGSLAARAGGQVAIVSGDRDLFQLVRDPDVWILYPKRGVSDLVTINETYIRERYGIPGRAYADFAILRGDPSDGLPGVRGIGEKTAAALIATHGSIEAVVAAAESGNGAGALGKVQSSIDYIKRAMRVVRITDEAPVGEPDLRMGDADPTAGATASLLGLGGPVERLRAAIEGREPQP
jgi:5'-3' exonuclease